MHRIVCKVWTVRNRPVKLTPRKREKRDLRIEASSSKRVQHEGGSSSLFSRILTRKSTESYSQKIEKFQMELAHADAVVIGAGARLSTAAVFLYSGECFQNYFQDLAKKYKFHDISKILENI